MSLLGRLTSAMGPHRSAGMEAQTPGERFSNGESVDAVTVGYGFTYPSVNVRSLFALARNSLVHTCLDVRASSIVQAPPMALGTDGKLAEGGVVTDFIKSPCPGWDWTTWLIKFLFQHDVSGSVFLYRLRRGERGGVLGYQFLHPMYVTIEVDASAPGGIIYVYEPRVGVRERYTIEEVWHFRTPHGTNDYYGEGPLESALHEVALDTAATNLNKAWVDNAGVPAGLMKVIKKGTAQISDAFIKAVQGAWKRMVGGARRGEVGIIGEDIEYLAMSALESPEMTALRDLVEARICGTFHVDARIAGANVGVQASSGTADAAVGEKVFWTIGMQPLYMRIAAFLTMVVQADLATGESLAFDFSGIQALQPDRLRQSEIAKNVVTGGIGSPNDGRRIMGLPELEESEDPDANKRLVPLSLIPVGSVLGLPPPAEAVEALSDTARARYLQIVSRTRERLEAAFVPVIERALQNLQREFNGRLGRAIADGAVFEVIIDPDLDQVIIDLGRLLDRRHGDVDLEGAFRAGASSAGEAGWELGDTLFDQREMFAAARDYDRAERRAARPEHHGEQLATRSTLRSRRALRTGYRRGRSRSSSGLLSRRRTRGGLIRDRPD